MKREWGRIGARGQGKVRWFDDPRAAGVALLVQAQRKASGYVAPREQEEANSQMSPLRNIASYTAREDGR